MGLCQGWRSCVDPLEVGGKEEESSKGRGRTRGVSPYKDSSQRRAFCCCLVPLGSILCHRHHLLHTLSSRVGLFLHHRDRSLGCLSALCVCVFITPLDSFTSVGSPHLPQTIMLTLVALASLLVLATGKEQKKHTPAQRNEKYVMV